MAEPAGSQPSPAAPGRPDLTAAERPDLIAPERPDLIAPRRSDLTAPERGGDPAVAFVLRLGRALHAHGYPAPLLESSLALVAGRLGLVGQFFSTPTAIFVSFGSSREDEPDERTFLLRVEPGEVDLEKLGCIEEVSAAVAGGQLSAAAGAACVAEVEAAPPRYGRIATTLAFAVASGSAASFFGGGWREALAATVIGLATGLLALGLGRTSAAQRIFEPLAAGSAALLATAAFRWIGPLSVYIATVSGLIVLIPGFTLTIALSELATRHLASGTARLTGALMVFLAIGFGVALGDRAGELLFGAAPFTPPVPLPGWAEWLGLAGTALGFTVLLRARPRDVPWVLAAGGLALAGARAGTYLLGSELGALVGALLVGVGSNLFSRLSGRPAAVTLVPGILLLVPGSVGFRSISALLERQTLAGVDTAFKMVVVAVAIVTGLLLANVVVPPGRPAESVGVR